MWGRGEPRDYLDVTALLAIYDPARLYALAAEKDRGLTVDTLVVSLRAVERFSDDDWADAGVGPQAAEQVRRTILGWRDQLLG